MTTDRRRREYDRHLAIHLGVGMLVRWLLLVLAFAASLAASLPAVAFAAREPASGPEALWRAFPFNPTGERIVPTVPAPGGTFRPPVAEAAVAPSPSADTPLLAVIGGSFVALLALGVLASVLLRFANHRRRLSTAGQAPSAHVSAVLIGTRWLPVIEGTLRRKRRAARKADIVPVLVGSAIAVAIALLIVHSVG